MKRLWTPRRSTAAGRADAPRARARTAAAAEKRPTRITRFMRNCSVRMADLSVPRHSGAAAAALLILASIGYGAVKGGHVPMIVGLLKDVRDAAANAAGFQAAGIVVQSSAPAGESS